MNATYFRVALYFIAPLAAMVPGVTYDSVAGQIILDLDTFAMGLAGAALASGAVFGIWGKK